MLVCGECSLTFKGETIMDICPNQRLGIHMSANPYKSETVSVAKEVIDEVKL